MKKVFVVDDEKSILEALEFMLLDEGYDVKTASKSTELQALMNDLPDVIILDVFLGGEDGREITKKLRSQILTRDIPVIMTSAHPSAQGTYKECGATEFLPKPFDIHVLLDMVGKYCN